MKTAGSRYSVYWFYWLIIGEKKICLRLKWSWTL